MTPTLTRCVRCPTFDPSSICDRCRFYRDGIAPIVLAVDARRYSGRDPVDRTGLELLDAVALILCERAETRRRHQRELREEQREAQLGARDAYVEGRHEGLAESRGAGW